MREPLEAGAGSRPGSAFRLVLPRCDRPSVDLIRVEVAPDPAKQAGVGPYSFAGGKEAVWGWRGRPPAASDGTYLPSAAPYGFVITADGRDWLISVAPTSNVDLFASRSANGDIILSDIVAGLHEGAALGLNLKQLAEVLSGAVTVNPTRTVVDGIARVPGGYTMRVRDGVLHLQRWWQPALVAMIRGRPVQQLADQLRVAAETAIERCLPISGPVAVQLSGGRDSGLLCAMVAERLAGQGREVNALTALPCLGLPTADERYQFDEEEAAFATAARYRDVRHQLFRPSPVPLASFLDDLHRQLGEPVHQPISLSWSLPQLARCAELGTGALLTGDDGNFTVSAGGLGYLADMLREDGLRPWLRLSSALMQRDGVTLRDVIRVSLGPALPLGLYQAGRRRGQPALQPNNWQFFKGHLRAQLAALTGGKPDPRPPASFRSLMQDVAGRGAPVTPVGRFAYGVELVTPWADRALFELMLSVPAAMLASPPDRRTLFDAAFGDLLPPEVLRPARRGLQNVDFHAAIDRQDLAVAVERYRGSALCRELVDLDRLESATADWPVQRVTDSMRRLFWLNDYMPALSVASFLYSRDKG